VDSKSHRHPPRSLARLLLRKLLLAYISFALVITAIQMFVEYRVVKTEIVNNLQSLAQTFSPGIESALWEYQQALLNSMVSGIGANPVVAAVDIVDLSGNNMGASWRSPRNLLPSDELAVEQAISHNDGNSTKVLGTLRIVSSDAVLISRLKDTLWWTGFSATAIFACLGLMLWLLARSLVVKPLVFFSNQVDALSVNGKGQQIDLGQVDVSEIERLRQVFNRLMHQIVEQNALLQYEKAQMRCIIDSIPDLIFIKDKDGCYLGCNKAFEAFAGRTEKEMIGKTDFDLFDAQAAEFFRQQDSEVMRVGTTRINDESVTYPNGRKVSLETLKTLFFGPDNTMLGLVGISRDISERKLAEIAVKRESEKNLALLRNASDGIHILNSEGNIIEASDSFCAMLGYQRSEMIGMNVTQWDPSRANPDRTKSIILERFAQQGRSQFETLHRRKNGTTIDVEVSCFPLELDGKLVLFYSSRDITERKKTETELRIAATAFQSESSIMITDANAVILRINQAFSESTGYTAEDIVGQKPRILKSGLHNEEFYRDMWESIRQTGTWQGEIWDRRKNGTIYPKWLTISSVKGNDGIVTHYIGSHVDITERKEAEEKIKHLAFYDHLTNLPNRLLLQDRLKQALVSSARNNRKGSLLFIDLDNFKNINDTLGHDIGDILLKQVSQRLESCLRNGDTVARLGGDEFVVMLLDLSDLPLEAAAQTEAISEKILVSLGESYQLEKNIYRCTASIGATLFGDTQQSTDELMKQADIAMYQAKQAGRNAIRFFDKKMQESISARVSLESELLRAIEFEQFRLYYQVQINSSNRPIGAEALIRWVHPERGLVSPAQFIPLAEESGLIHAVGQWVLETACAQINAWQQDELTRDLILSVNVSAKQFLQTDFVAQIQTAIQRNAINPRLLKLEATESLLLDNFENTITAMNALKEIGVQFSLDDFGTGYSSLQYLKRLPLSQLKIDQSFVRDLGTDSSDKAIVRTIIAMAKSLNLDVIAEGVETEQQMLFLLNNGCMHFQGYLFGKPVPIAQFNESLRNP
jgi:diguanylate cyclase (GGDEF)-like protein/PAS domain S-box-containing protein